MMNLLDENSVFATRYIIFIYVSFDKSKWNLQEKSKDALILSIYYQLFKCLGIIEPNGVVLVGSFLINN